MADKKRGTHYLAVERDYLIQGISAIEKLWAEDLVSRDTLRLVIKDLKDKVKEEKLSALVAWYDENCGGGGNLCKPGEQRPYKAQSTKSAVHPFIKLPLWANAEKGCKVIARHSEPGEPLGIHIRPAARGE